MTDRSPSIQIAGLALPERRWLGIAVMIALVLRAAFAFGYWVDRPLTVDQVEYLMLADNLLEGAGLTYDDPHRLMRSPGYPVLLAAIRSMATGLAGVKATQTLLGALSVLLVAALARRIGGSRAGVVGALAMACYPPQIFQTGYVLSETLFTATALVSLILCWRVADEHGPHASAGSSRWTVATAAGVSVGLTVLVRPEFLLFALLFSSWLTLTARGVTAAVLLGVMATTVAPWPLYNLVAHERVILLSSRGGPNLWMGNNEHATGDGDVSGHPHMEAAYQEILRTNRSRPPEEIERVFYAKTFDYVTTQPVAFAVNVARKAFYFWVPLGTSYTQRSTLFWLAHATSFLILLGAALRGLPSLLRHTPFPWVLVVLLVSVYLTCLIFFPLARYRVPVFDPVLIVIASIGLQSTSRRSRSTVSTQ